MIKTLSFKRVAAQGELTITRLLEFPKDIGKVVHSENDQLIVGHSETGHHHVVDANCAILTRVDDFLAYLQVVKPTEVKHLRSFDTHFSIPLQPGMYEFKTGREFDPFESVIRASKD
jgi:hypothetical protein